MLPVEGVRHTDNVNMATESDNLNLFLHILTNTSHDIDNTALLPLIVLLLRPSVFVLKRNRSIYLPTFSWPREEIRLMNPLRKVSEIKTTKNVFQ